MDFYGELLAMIAIPFLSALYIAITIAAIAVLVYAVRAVIWLRYEFSAFHEAGVERLREAAKNSVQTELKSH